MFPKSLTVSKTISTRIRSFLLFLYYVFESLFFFFIPELLIPKHFKNVQDQKVLITGGGNGIGQLMAVKFLELGAKVIIWDIDMDGLNQTKSMAESKVRDAKLYCYQMDLSKKESIYQTAQRVQKEVGHVDILINNAGVVNGKNLLDLTEEKIAWSLKVNTISHFFTIKAFLPEMIKRKKGHIVTVASICGDIGAALLSDYCASKFANVGMDQSLRLELAKANLSGQIKTTIVKPWLIHTSMFFGAHSGLFPGLHPEDVAKKIVEAILQNKLVLVIPWYLEYLIPLLSIIPSKCLIPVYDFMGGFESMDNFQGRQSKLKDETIKLIKDK